MFFSLSLGNNSNKQDPWQENKLKAHLFKKKLLLKDNESVLKQLMILLLWVQHTALATGNCPHRLLFGRHKQDFDKSFDT